MCTLVVMLAALVIGAVFGGVFADHQQPCTPGPDHRRPVPYDLAGS